MIPYDLQEEREMILFYADLLGDSITREYIARDGISTPDEARHLAQFFWQMVDKSEEIDYDKTMYNCDYLMERVLITFMTYFRSAGFEQQWREFVDARE